MDRIQTRDDLINMLVYLMNWNIPTFFALNVAVGVRHRLALVWLWSVYAMHAVLPARVEDAFYVSSDRCARTRFGLGRQREASIRGVLVLTAWGDGVTWPETERPQSERRRGPDQKVRDRETRIRKRETRRPRSRRESRRDPN